MENNQHTDIESLSRKSLTFADGMRLAAVGAYLLNLYQTESPTFFINGLENKGINFNVNCDEFRHKPVTYLEEALRNKAVETFLYDAETEKFTDRVNVYFVEDCDLDYAADHDWEREWFYEGFVDQCFVFLSRPSMVNKNKQIVEAIAPVKRPPHDIEKQIEKSFTNEGIERSLKPVFLTADEETKLKVSPRTTVINSYDAAGLLFGAFLDLHVMSCGLYKEPDPFDYVGLAEIEGRACRFYPIKFGEIKGGIDSVLENKGATHLFMMKGGRNMFASCIPNEDEIAGFIPVTTVEEFCKIYEASKGEITLAICPLLSQEGATHAVILNDGRVEFSNIDGKVSLEVFLHTPKVAPEQEDQVLEESETQA